jgi:thymidylate synthase (FAD)
MNIKGKEDKVLDHGFVRVVDTMGDDSAVVQAARVSYGSGTKGVREDRDLIRFLLRQRHTSPFEMAEIKLHCKMPIFVARQWVRHRTANINEVSARYSELPGDFYIPDLDQIREQSGTNKQGRGDAVLDTLAHNFRDSTQGHSLNSYAAYGADLQSGIARELARINLPLNIYTEWYWKVDVHNLLHFLNLRADGHAQYEIRVYADAILKFVEEWMPETHGAFTDYVYGAVTLSRMEVEILHNFMSSRDDRAIETMRILINQKDEMSNREKIESLSKFGLD